MAIHPQGDSCNSQNLRFFQVQTWQFLSSAIIVPPPARSSVGKHQIGLTHLAIIISSSTCWTDNPCYRFRAFSALCGLSVSAPHRGGDHSLRRLNVAVTTMHYTKYPGKGSAQENRAASEAARGDVHSVSRRGQTRSG